MHYFQLGQTRNFKIKIKLILLLTCLMPCKISLIIIKIILQAVVLMLVIDVQHDVNRSFTRRIVLVSILNSYKDRPDQSFTLTRGVEVAFGHFFSNRSKLQAIIIFGEILRLCSVCAVDCFKSTLMSSFVPTRCANLHELNNYSRGLCLRSLVMWAWWLVNKSPTLSVTTFVNTVGYPDTTK